MHVIPRGSKWRRRGGCINNVRDNVSLDTLDNNNK